LGSPFQFFSLFIFKHVDFSTRDLKGEDHESTFCYSSTFGRAACELAGERCAKL
jgi:hypothetical protein